MTKCVHLNTQDTKIELSTDVKFMLISFPTLVSVIAKDNFWLGNVALINRCQRSAREDGEKLRSVGISTMEGVNFIKGRCNYRVVGRRYSLFTCVIAQSGNPIVKSVTAFVFDSMGKQLWVWLIDIVTTHSKTEGGRI